nr:MAG TPA: hypothetical protein [Caudoviricetes sp.]
MYALFLFYILLLNFLIFLTLSISAEYAGLFVIALAIAIVGLTVTESFIIPMIKDLYKMYKNREILPEGTHAVNLRDNIKSPRQRSVNIK